MKIVVSGGTGFIGKPLCHSLSASGHDVILLTRQSNVQLTSTGTHVRVVHWDGMTRGQMGVRIEWSRCRHQSRRQANCRSAMDSRPQESDRSKSYRRDPASRRGLRLSPECSARLGQWIGDRLLRAARRSAATRR